MIVKPESLAINFLAHIWIIKNLVYNIKNHLFLSSFSRKYNQNPMTYTSLLSINSQPGKSLNEYQFICLIKDKNDYMVRNNWTKKTKQITLL